MTRLISVCDRTLEASWLTALACVPLFFGPWAEVLQSEKSYLLRSISILVLTVWIIRFLAKLGTTSGPGSGMGSRIFRSTPVISLALLLLLAWSLSTMAGIEPRDGFWGDATRRHGTFSLACCLVIFFALVSHIRSHAMVDRLLTVSIVTTVPICFYGIAQKFGIEPLIFAGSDSFRVGSTFRNPVFLSAYLILVFPITLSRLLMQWPSNSSLSTKRWAEIRPAFIYGTVAALQLTTILFTVSRGPTLGLIIGSFMMALMMANYWRKRWFVFVAFGAALLLLISFLLLFLQIGPFSRLANQPSIQRFTSMFGPKADSSGRAAIWNLAADAAHFSKTAEISPGQLDIPPSARLLIGYGPESARFLSRVYRSPEYNGAIQDGYLDRFHNDFWETLLTTGLVGLLVWTCLWIYLIYSGFKWLGFTNDRHQTIIFFSLLASGAITGSIALTVWQGIGFLGVGQMMGVSAGLMVFLAYQCWKKGPSPTSSEARPKRPILVMALLSALIAHWVEIQFSFPTETTLLFFWVWTALLILEGNLLLQNKESLVQTVQGETQPTFSTPALSSKALTGSKPKPDLPYAQLPNRKYKGFVQFNRPWNFALFPSAVIAMTLAYLGEMLILSHLREGNTAIRTLWDAFTRLAGNQNSFSWFLPASIIMVCLLTAAVFRTEADSSSPQHRPAAFLPAVLVLGGSIGLLFCFGLAAYASRYIAWTRVNLNELDKFLANYTFLVDLHYASTLIMIGFVAVCLPSMGQPNTTSNGSRGHAVLQYCVAVLLAFSAAIIVFRTSMASSKTEVLVSRADYFKSRLDWKLVEVICRKGLRDSPRTDSLSRLLSESLIEQALTVPDPGQSDLLLLKADQILKTAGENRPYEISWYVRRGDLSRLRAERTNAESRKTEIAREAIAFYETAARLDPFNDEVWYRMAYVAMAILNSPDTAIPWLERSIQCYPKSHSTFALLGNAYFAKGANTNDPEIQRTLFQQAAANYQNAIISTGTAEENTHNRYLYTIAVAKCSIKLKDMQRAIQAYKNALEISPPAEQWTNEEMLGRLYIDLREKTNALFHLGRALELAPPEHKSKLLNLQKLGSALP